MKPACIIMHERALCSDFLMGLLEKRVLARRRHLKLIAISATMDAEHLLLLWYRSRIYHPLEHFPGLHFFRTPYEDYVDSALR